MSMMKKYLIYGFWVIAAAFLIYVSFGYNDSSSSILAQVEPEKYAVSFQKAVRVKEIYVIPGQRVKKGDKLIKVERQDLLLDVDRKTNQIENLRSQLNIMLIERRHRQSMARLTLEERQTKAAADLERLDFLIKNQKGVTQNLNALQLLGDSIASADLSYLKMRKQIVQTELENAKTQYDLQVLEIRDIYDIRKRGIESEIAHVEEEIALLQREERELVQFAINDGTIGNVYVEIGELVPPYNTLISVYNENPTIIRALMHEHQNGEFKSGDMVVVESTNRKYKTEGAILEIGSRIIEYPERLRTFQTVPVYGREIFIKIPEESNFLNGEKVYVKLQ